MRTLLTSAGIRNTSIHDALVDLLGKPIAESSALCIPTAMYGHPGRSRRRALAVHQRASPTNPMCELGWKSLGVLELTALPSIDEERWVPLVRETDVLLVGGRRRPVPVPLDAAVRAGGPPAVAARDGLGGAERREHGDDPQDRGGLRRVEAAHRWRQHAGDRRLLDLSAPGSARTCRATPWPRQSRWAAGIAGPAYAIDDETAIKVVDGTVEVVSEGHWKLFP